MEEHKEHDKEHKEEHKEEKPEAVKRKKVSIWKILTVVFGIALIVSLFVNFRGGERTALTGQEVAEKAVKYINDNVLVGTTATFEQVEEENGLYNIKLNVGGREYETYATKDGRLLFPSVIDLNVKPEEIIQQQPNQINYTKTEKPDVLLFTMSYCPYGNQAETGINPVAELLGNKINIEPHYVIYSNHKGGGPDYCFDEENKYCSMHGITELNQDIRELCIFKYQKEKFWKYIDIVNSNCSLQNIEACWKEAAEQAGVNAEDVEKCFTEEALKLLEAEAALNKKYNVQGSPTVLINEQSYEGGRTPEAYKTAMCSAFEEAPAECEQTLSSGEGAVASGQC